MNDLRKQFPALKNQLYLNTASSGLIHTGLYAWRNELEKDFLEYGADYMARKKIIEHTRETVGSFFTAKPSEIALVPNFSFGLNTLIEGIPGKKKILLLAQDYPSLSWPIVMRDFDVQIIKTSNKIEAEIIKAIEIFKPDYFLFSVVQWLSGVKLASSFLTQLKSKYPKLILIADGTQYLGTEAFDFSTSAIDVIGGSGYKWMLSGFGNGFFLIKEHLQSKIYPKTIGFNSAQHFDSTPQETSFIKHFEPGHQAAISYGSLAQSLLWLSDNKKNKLTEHITTVASYAKQRFASLGLIEDYIVEREHSSIFNLKLNNKAYHYLLKNKVNCSLRGGGVRVSFHFYNTKEEVNTLCDLIEQTTR